MIRARPLFLWLARLAVAGIFLGACAAKIRDPEAFALAVYRYRLLPDILINPAAMILPWIELLGAVALLLPLRRARAASALIITGMLAVFTAAIAFNLFRGIEIACGCFSTRADAAVSDTWNLLRNGALIWLSAALLMDAWPRPTPVKKS
ncbi:MAG: DoxX family protein [Lentisphaerae bacterium]|jgi:uncharacterized membrane protein YphA (DoxX/SURF4 family)|nr:DoxX family protein [Lentisphaerota bacterium]